MFQIQLTQNLSSHADHYTLLNIIEHICYEKLKYNSLNLHEIYLIEPNSLKLFKTNKLCHD